jgi:hypothetical protein
LKNVANSELGGDQNMDENEQLDDEDDDESNEQSSDWNLSKSLVCVRFSEINVVIHLFVRIFQREMLSGCPRYTVWRVPRGHSSDLATNT